MSLDAQKAFDLVDHEYMYKTLKSFGFGEEFIHTIKTIYNDLSASILVNGYKTEILRLLRGVKQGDALSCALFIICVEPLFRAIQEAQGISGLKVRSPYTLEQVECKISGYADDFTPIAANVESIKEIFKIYYKFSQISGIHLNPGKTEILKIGPHYNDPDYEIVVEYGQKVYNVKTSRQIVVCGITHPMSNPESYKQNITNKITKMKNLLNSWRCRSLSLIGKILITKVYGLSQLIYFLQTCPIEMKDLKIIDSAIYSFIWSARTARPNDKIKRATLKCPVIEGGLNAPDIFSLNRALKFKKWLRTTQNTKHPVSIVQDRILFLEGIKDKYPQELHKRVIDSINCQFYQLAMDTNNTLTNLNHKRLYLDHSRDEVDPDQLTFLASHPLASSPYLQNNPNKAQILRRLSILGILNLGALVTLCRDNPQGLAWLEIHQCLTAFPKLWVKLLTERMDWKLNSYTNEYINIAKYKWAYGQYTATRQIRIVLTSTKASPIEKLDLMCKHRLDVNSPGIETTPDNPFKTKVADSVYMQSLHFRVLHRAFTTRSKLFMYKIIESPICPFCEDGEDNFEHALYECDLAKHTWTNLQTWMNIHNIEVQIQISNIIMGFKTNIQFGSLVNTIMLHVKRLLLSPNETRRSLSIEEIDRIIKVQFRVERAMVKKLNKKFQHNKYERFKQRWAHLEHLFDEQ